jgi:hypothetical protein
MNWNKKLIALFLTIAVPALSLTVMAQGGPPVGGNPPCWPPPCIPIDGGLGFLVAAGIAYGGKKVLDLRKDEA